MFNFFKKKNKQGTKVIFKLSGLHCSSCGISIDNALEETEGVIESSTSYAKAESTIYFDSSKTDEKSSKKLFKTLVTRLFD